MDPDPLTNFGRNIRAANCAEEQEPILVDVVDDEADLVHMPRIHEAELGVWIDDCRDVSHHICCHDVRIGFATLSIELSDRLLEAARRRRPDEGFQ